MKEVLIIVVLLAVINLIGILVNILKANFVDVTKFSPVDMFNPIWWIKHPPLILILILAFLNFGMGLAIYKYASILTSAGMTIILPTVLAGLVGAIFGLMQFLIYHLIRGEVVTQEMWLWIIVATILSIALIYVNYNLWLVTEKAMPK